MEATMHRTVLVLLKIVVGFSCFVIINVNGLDPSLNNLSNGNHPDQMQKMEASKSSSFRRKLASSPSPSPSPAPSPTCHAPAASAEAAGNDRPRPRLIHATSFGADPTGKYDSTTALIRAIESAFVGSGERFLMAKSTNLAGAHISLENGNYMISRPLRLPVVGAGNLMISGGTLRASYNFPTDGYLIELSGSPSSHEYEYVTLKDLMLDCNFRGGGLSVINSHRTSVDNCYIAHFKTNGILIQQGHEVYIRNSFVGRQTAAGGDSGERNCSGTGINLMQNDNL